MVPLISLLLTAVSPPSVLNVSDVTLFLAVPGLMEAFAVAGGLKLLDSLFGWFGQDNAAQNQAILTKYSADLQQRNWNDQFNQTNEYNLPSNQVSRLMAAGVNPFVQGSTASPIASTAGSVSAPSPSAPAVSGYDFGGSSSSQLDAANRLMQNPDVSPTVHANVTADTRNKTAGARLQSSVANKQDLENKILALTGQEHAELANKFLKKDIERIESLVDLQDYEALEAWQAALHHQASASLDANKANSFMEYVNAYIDQMKADSEYKRSTSALQDQELREQRVKSNIAEKTEDSVMQQIVSEAYARAEKARVEGDNAELTFWTDYVSDILRTGSDVFGSVMDGLSKGAFKGLSKEKSNEIRERVKLDRDKFEHQKDQDSKVTEDYSDEVVRYDQRGRKHRIKSSVSRKRPSQ